MKSLTAVCQNGAAAMPAINTSGRISRHVHQRGDGENAEMKMYLSKLKDLVPFMPKNRKLSKLEIIQHVIDYICDLQTELETHPDVNNFDAASALAAVTASNQVMLSQRLIDSQHTQAQQQQHQQQQQQQQHHNNQQQQQYLQQQQQYLHASPATITRQPLVDRQTPNTILPTPAVATSSAATTTPSLVVTAAAATTIMTTSTTSMGQQQQPPQNQISSSSALPTATEKESKSSRLSPATAILF